MLLGINHYMPELGIGTNLPLAIIAAGAMVVGGIVLATLFTFFAVTKFVRMKSNKIYLY
jgi:cell division transport system permease protein